MTTMMKIKNVFLLAAAMTIAWTVVACSSSEDEIEEQPTLGGGIKAQFTISVPTTVGNTTRQNATVVQNSGNFRGINFIKLYPSALSKSAFESATTKSIGENTALTELIIPSTKEKVSANSYIPNDRLIGESHSVVYGDVQLQLGTRSFLFYGQAIGEEKNFNTTLESFSANDKFINGYLDFKSLIEGNIY